MNWNFTLTKAQLKAFMSVVHRRVAARSRRNYTALAIGILAWVAAGFAVAAFVNLYEEIPDLASDMHEIAISAAIAVAGFYGVRLYSQRMVNNYCFFANDSLARVPQSVVAGPEGLEIAFPGGKTHYDWKTFVDLVEDDVGLYLFLDLCNAVVIPKSIGASAEDLERLRGWARRQSVDGLNA